jgi:hypothetical protein
MPERVARHGEKITTTIAHTVLVAVCRQRNSRVAKVLPVRLGLPSSSTATHYYFPSYYSNNDWTEIWGRSESPETNFRHSLSPIEARRVEIFSAGGVRPRNRMIVDPKDRRGNTSIVELAKD